MNDHGPAPSRRAAAILLAAAALVLYLTGGDLGFYYDDRVTILHNRSLQESAAAAAAENPFRAVVNLTFALQFRLHRPDLNPAARTIAAALPHIVSEKGDRLRPVYLDPQTGARVPVSIDRDRGLVFPLPPAWPFRLFNLALHLVNGLLLFLILKRIGLAPPLAAAAAAVFILHPLATEPVNYITARFTLLSVTFALAAVHAHLRADGRARGEILALALFLLALFCKETAAVLPLLVIVFDAARGRPRFAALIGLLASLAYFLARTQWTIVLGAHPGDVLPWTQYLLAEQRVFWLYALKTLLPIHLNFDYDLAPRPALDGLFALLNLGLLGLSGRLIYRAFRPGAAGAVPAEKKGPERKGAKDKRDQTKAGPAASQPALWAAAVFLLCWLALAPSSSFIPLADLAKEDRAYPLIAILVPAAAAALARLLRTGPAGRKRAAVVLAAAVLCLMATLTYGRNQAWKTELRLSRDFFMKSPRKPRAVYNYATALKWSGNLPSALFWYRRTLELDPAHDNARANVEALEKLAPAGR
jgi:hypothetical protein